jgi:hypothetical protein
MKVINLVLGAIFLVLGLFFTGYSWYAAGTSHHIIDGLAYPGPFLIIVGAWRVISAGVVGAARMLRIVAVLVGLAAGYGNAQVLKAAYPNDTVVSADNTSK